jgi:DNA polymerase-3 subunit delta
LTRERGDRLAGHFVDDAADPFAVSELSVETLGADPARFADEMASLPMLGGRRLVRVRDADDVLFTAIDRFLSSPPTGDSVAILEAGELDKRSKLRLRIEDDPNAIALPSYQEEGRALDATIATLLKEQGFSIARDALQELGGLLPPDRLGVRSEVNKLVTYAHDRKEKRIALADIDALIAAAGGQNVDAAIDAAAGGERATLDALLNRLAAEGTAPIQILRGAQRHFLRLYEAASLMGAENIGAGEAIKRLRPPVFFKKEEAMAAQLRRWSAPRIARALALLLEAEAKGKNTGMPAELLAQRALLSLASGGRR